MTSPRDASRLPAQGTFRIYLVAIVAVAMATLVRWQLSNVLGPHTPFLTFFPAVIIAVWFGGWRGGLAATALSVVSAWYFFVPNLRSFEISSISDWAGLLLFFLTALAITGFGGEMYSAQRVARETAARAQEQAETLRVTLTSIGDAVLATDMAGVIRQANPVALALLCGQPGDVLGKKLEDVFRIVNESTRQPVENPVRRVIAEGRIMGLANHTILIALDGSECPIDDSAAPIHDQQGRIIGAVMVFRDISERKQAEDRLSRSEALFRTLGEAVPDFLWMCDAQARPLYLNPAGQTYLGQPYNPDRAGDFVRFLHPDDVPALNLAWVQGAKHRQAFLAECRIRCHDGTYLWFQCRAVPLLNDTGRIERWVGTMTDIHQRKVAEDSLRDADRRKDEFLATLAHELRNPLGPLSSGVQLLKLRLSGGTLEHNGHDSDLAQLLGILERQLQQMVRLIDDLLEVSRITRGKIELRKEVVDLRSLVEAAIVAAKPDCEARQQQLEASIPPMPVWIDADPVRISQVMTNLLNNAQKFTEPGGRIHVAVSAERDHATVAVSDSGVGIPPEMLSHVFEMFHQVDQSRTRQYGGLGIGLTLVKRFVELHGGSVEAHSAGVGQGSTFKFHLPHHAGSVTSPPSASPESLPPALRTRSVLVVDDTRASAYVLGKLLEALGQRVATYHDADTALQMARTLRPEIIFSDIAMPVVDGYEFARRIRRESTLQHVMLVALTGYGQECDRAASRDAGFDHHLVKPVSMTALREILSFPYVCGDSPPG